MVAPCRRKAEAQMRHGRKKKEGPGGTGADLIGLVHPCYFRSVGCVEGVRKSNMKSLGL